LKRIILYNLKLLTDLADILDFKISRLEDLLNSSSTRQQLAKVLRDATIPLDEIYIKRAEANIRLAHNSTTAESKQRD
jgi:hypothetical protein